MIKDSPNPPSDSTPQPSDQLFTVLSNLNSETLLANASQDLASVQALMGNLAFEVDGPQRDVVLGAHRMLEGIQLMVDRVLDLYEIPAATATGSFPRSCVGMHPVTLRVTLAQGLSHAQRRDAERPGRHSHAERGNDHRVLDLYEMPAATAT